MGDPNLDSWRGKRWSENNPGIDPSFGPEMNHFERLGADGQHRSYLEKKNPPQAGIPMGLFLFFAIPLGVALIWPSLFTSRHTLPVLRPGPAYIASNTVTYQAYRVGELDTAFE